MKKRRIFSLLLTLGIIGICALLVLSPTMSAASMPKAGVDLIITNGKIVTVNKNPWQVQVSDKGFRIAEAVAVKDGIIVAVGTEKQIGHLAGSMTKVMDLHGKTMLPGIHDTHMHMQEAGIGDLYILKMGGAGSIAGIQAILKAKAKQMDDAGDTTGWILGNGLVEFYLAEGRVPTRQELDVDVGNHPVLIDRFCWHQCIVNTKAFEIAGIPLTGSPTAPPGGQIMLDLSGSPTGLLKEAPAMNLVKQFIPKWTPEQRLAGIAQGQSTVLKAGVTSVTEISVIQDPYGGDWDQDENYYAINAYKETYANGDLKVRADVYYTLRRLSDLDKLPYWEDMRDNSANDPMLRLAGVKMFMDGSCIGQNAWLWQPFSYPGGENNYGYPLIDPQVYETMVMESHRMGWQVSTHAVGDRTIDTVVGAYKKAQDTYRNRHDLRHIIIHVKLPSKWALRTMHDYGMSIAVQSHWKYFLGDAHIGLIGWDRAAYVNPVRSMLKNYVNVGEGSDYDVLGIHPWLSIWCAVNRLTAAGVLLGENERISVPQAIWISTMGGAYMSHQERKKGSITKGKFADFVVIDKDILTIDPLEIKDIKTLMTIVGGKVQYQDPDFNP
jgi:predicted amidohydrolase YtcJ